MKILLNTRTMGYLSGSPLYVYTTAIEMAKDNEVSVLSDWSVIGTEGAKLRLGLEKAGVMCIDTPEAEYDLIFASQFRPKCKGFTINIVHSEYDCETPLPDCDFYVCIRPSIKEHIIKEHSIPEDKIMVIYNGVDRERFKKLEKPKRDFKLTVVPCTIDPLREKFINHLCSKASEKNRYMFIGDYFGAKIKRKEFTYFFPAKFNIEEDICGADEVAGILLGRVNLEANSAGIPSLIYDPETLEVEKFFLSEEEFDKKHSIKNVVKALYDIRK